MTVRKITKTLNKSWLKVVSNVLLMRNKSFIQKVLFYLLDFQASQVSYDPKRKKRKKEISKKPSSTSTGKKLEENVDGGK